MGRMVIAAIITLIGLTPACSDDSGPPQELTLYNLTGADLQVAFSGPTKASLTIEPCMSCTGSGRANDAPSKCSAAEAGGKVQRLARGRYTITLQQGSTEHKLEAADIYFRQNDAPENRKAFGSVKKLCFDSDRWCTGFSGGSSTNGTIITSGSFCESY